METGAQTHSFLFYDARAVYFCTVYDDHLKPTQISILLRRVVEKGGKGVNHCFTADMENELEPYKKLSDCVHQRIVLQ